MLEGRFFTDAAKRLLFSYRSMYAEARIYTRQFDRKCELVCKYLIKESSFNRKGENYANFQDTFLIDFECASETVTDVTSF